jgi:serine/threonine protein kinase
MLMAWNSPTCDEKYLVVELMEKSLKDCVSKDTSGEFVWRGKGRQIAEDVCRGLLYLHSNLGIYHADVKLRNILVKGAQAKLTDLGVFQSKTDLAPNKPYKFVGTPGYMSPEILLQDVDASSALPIHGPDMFAFGIVLGVLVAVNQQTYIEQLEEKGKNLNQWLTENPRARIQKLQKKTL